jgi:hypothetical protein
VVFWQEGTDEVKCGHICRIAILKEIPGHARVRNIFSEGFLLQLNRTHSRKEVDECSSEKCKTSRSHFDRNERVGILDELN